MILWTAFTTAKVSCAIIRADDHLATSSNIKKQSCCPQETPKDTQYGLLCVKQLYCSICWGGGKTNKKNLLTGKPCYFPFILILLLRKCSLQSGWPRQSSICQINTFKPQRCSIIRSDCSEGVHSSCAFSLKGKSQVRANSHVRMLLFLQ